MGYLDLVESGPNDAVLVSALTGEGIGDLLEMIESQLTRSDAFVGDASPRAGRRLM